MEGVTYSALAVDDEYAILYRALKMHRRADELVFSQSRNGNSSSKDQNRILLEIDSTGEGTPVASGRGQWTGAIPPLNFGLSENCRNILFFFPENSRPKVRNLRLKLLILRNFRG